MSTASTAMAFPSPGIAWGASGRVSPETEDKPPCRGPVLGYAEPTPEDLEGAPCSEAATG